MKDMKMITLATALTVLMISQIVLGFLLYNPSGLEALRNTGWIVIWISAIFGWLPISALKKRGRVPKGKSYVHTTVLVDTGIYSICRHPQYLAGILLGLALALIVQHWIVTALGLAVMVMLYRDMLDADKLGIKSFGDGYKRYMKRVPRANFLLGLARLLRKGMARPASAGQD
jgi:protein-S-isoprenylcysteine O-methyltransferase Ste14